MDDLPKTCIKNPWAQALWPMEKIFDFPGSSVHSGTCAISTRSGTRTSSGFGKEIFLEKLAYLFLMRKFFLKKVKFFCFGIIIYKLWGGKITQKQKGTCNANVASAWKEIFLKTTMVMSHLID